MNKYFCKFSTDLYDVFALKVWLQVGVGGREMGRGMRVGGFSMGTTSFSIIFCNSQFTGL